jgi:cytochrome c5
MMRHFPQRMKAVRPRSAWLFRDPRGAAILPAFFFNGFPAAVSQPESSDTHFFNSFSVVLGILIAFTICLFAFARGLGRDYQLRDVRDDPLVKQQAAQDTAPFAHEAIAGQDNSALAIAPTPAGGASGSAAAVPTTGEEAFKQVCSACHGTGLNGAPKAGDKAAWAPRIAQGKDTLYKDAISGKGLMPPKGGTTWPDATIRMTVDYMVSLAK